MARMSSVTMPSMVGILRRAPVVDEKCDVCLLPAGLRALRVIQWSKMGFRPVEATRCSDKQKFGMGADPKTVKSWNFAHKFVPQGRLSFAQFLPNSQRLYASTASLYVFSLVAFGEHTTKL